MNHPSANSAILFLIIEWARSYPAILCETNKIDKAISDSIGSLGTKELQKTSILWPASRVLAAFHTPLGMSDSVISC